MKSAGFLEGAKYFHSDIKISGANKQVFTVAKVMKKRLKFFTQNNGFFTIDEFFIIEGLSSDLNISKMTMASLDLKWCFKNDFVEIKGVKIPLSESGKKKELLEIKGNREKPE